MLTPVVTSLGTQPTAHPERKPCGHARHIGSCPACQRAARTRSQAQLAAAAAAREAWAAEALLRTAA